MSVAILSRHSPGFDLRGLLVTWSKLLVAAGEVRVDGQPEMRKTAKIRAGQVVECLGRCIRVMPHGTGPAGEGR